MLQEIFEIRFNYRSCNRNVCKSLPPRWITFTGPLNHIHGPRLRIRVLIKFTDSSWRNVAVNIQNKISIMAATKEKSAKPIQ